MGCTADYRYYLLQLPVLRTALTTANCYFGATLDRSVAVRLSFDVLLCRHERGYLHQGRMSNLATIDFGKDSARFATQPFDGVAEPAAPAGLAGFLVGRGEADQVLGGLEALVDHGGLLDLACGPAEPVRHEQFGYECLVAERRQLLVTVPDAEDRRTAASDVA